MKNLIIITSVINISDNPLDYTNVRSIYSTRERYEQTIKTIESCKLVNNSHILFIETSDLNKVMEDNIKLLTDYYVNLTDNEEVRNVIDGPTKGKGEATQIWHGLDNVDITRYDNIFKISGRYWLNENFHYDMYDNEDNVYKEGPGRRTLGTASYKINKKNYDRYLECLEYCKNSNEQLEKIFAMFFKKNYITYDKIGLSGYVSVDGNLIDW